MMMYVEVYLYTQSKSITIYYPTNCYQKGDFYCVIEKKKVGTVTHKFPLQHIFKIREVVDG